ncbi:hypothetical protein CNEO2_1120005 [Clostridium neonatale]|nr:hypothetical protein CNEO2_1120005 [Clostridium neonatale]
MPINNIIILIPIKITLAILEPIKNGTISAVIIYIILLIGSSIFMIDFLSSYKLMLFTYAYSPSIEKFFNFYIYSKDNM